MSKETAPDSQEKAPTLDEQINEALKKVGDNGKLIFDDGIDPLFKRAVLAEKKFRDTKAGYTKSRQELAQLRAKAEVFESQLSSNIQLTAEQVDELEDLKSVDPDEWYTKKMEYERQAKEATKSKLDELASEASTKALQELTKGERTSILEEFNSQKGLNLTEEIMEYDVPPRIQKQAESMSYEEYLEVVANYLSKGKVVKQTDDGLDQVNIHSLPGAEGNTTSKKSYTIL